MNILFAGLLFVAALGPMPEIAVGQTVTPTATVVTDWTLPNQPLLPYQYDEPEEVIEAPVTPGVLWEVARIALTAYNIISGGNSATWLLFAAILLLPIAGVIIYRLLTSPPEI